MDEELNRRLGCIEQKLDKVRTEDLPAIRVEVSALKVKAGAWGAVAGLLGSLAAILGALALR